MPGPASLKRTRWPVSDRPARADLSGDVLLGDAFDLLNTLSDRSIDLILTSPPYWGHREYGLDHNWDLFNNIQGVKRDFGAGTLGYRWYRDLGGVLGLEPYPEWYVQHLAEIFAKAARCLLASGSLWVNVGDTYFARWASIRENGRQGLAEAGRQRRKTPMGGFRQEKQLLLIPARFAIAMQEQGWILRNDLIWHKPNAAPRPESDRLKLSHEHFFHFVKRPKEGRPAYYYDARFAEPRQNDVVSVNVAAGEEGHTATFPRALIVPRILSSSPPGGVVLDPFCGTGRALEVAREFGRRAIGFDKRDDYRRLAQAKVSDMAKPRAAVRNDAGNYISEWYGRRIYPAVRLDGIKSIAGANKGACPFLSQVLAQRTDCWKGAGSKGVCTISATSNGVRQDWLACPHRVIHTDIVKQSCARIFGPDAGDAYPVPVSALVRPEQRQALIREIERTGRAFLFFQDKLGGEISIAGTAKSPEMSFDVTLVEILQTKDGTLRPGRYGLMEVQTMDFHGSYRDAVTALNNALDLHGEGFPATLQQNLGWAGRGVEGPNIANVFKRTFYQIMIKFQLAVGAAAAGTVLALPRAVWDSWQPFLGAPELVRGADGTVALAGTRPDTPNAHICVFDLDPAAGDPDPGATGVAGAKDISPVRTELFIRVDPALLARHAFSAVPAEILSAFADGDLILASICARLAKWWPELTEPGP